MWRFTFSWTMSVCITLRKTKRGVTQDWHWKLGDQILKNVEALTLLGMQFTPNLSSKAHVENRVTATQNSVRAKARVGLSYPGLNTETKTYLWNSSGLPVLAYGCCCVDVTRTDMQRLERCQGCLLKSCFGLHASSKTTCCP